MRVGCRARHCRCADRERCAGRGRAAHRDGPVDGVRRDRGGVAHSGARRAALDGRVCGRAGYRGGRCVHDDHVEGRVGDFARRRVRQRARDRSRAKREGASASRRAADGGSAVVVGRDAAQVDRRAVRAGRLDRRGRSGQNRWVGCGRPREDDERRKRGRPGREPAAAYAAPSPGAPGLPTRRRALGCRHAYTASSSLREGNCPFG